MIDAGDIPDAVQWHEGMLLCPQHFQQADLRAHALQSYLTLNAAPYAWGIRRLGIDRAALIEGTFAVTELEAIMPDGLLVRHPSDRGAGALQLDLRALPAELGAGSVAVHLTVAVQGSLAAREGRLQRFRSIEGDEVVDDNTGDNALPIPRLVPALGLHATDGPLRAAPGRYVSLPLAVLQSGARGFSAVDYEVPRLRVEPGTRLLEVARGVATELRGKAKAWGELLHGELFRGRAAGARDSAATLRTMVRGLPRLEALLETGLAHPFEVYLSLCDIAGDLALIGEQLMLPAPGRYAHADPLTGYAILAAFVRGALAALRTPHRSLTFEHPAPGRFELALLTEHVGETLVIGARLAPDQDAASTGAWFAAAMVAGSSRVAALRLNRVNGARRVAVGGAPEMDLVAPPNVLLFRVTVDPAFIGAGETLQVSLPAGEAAGEPAELQLFLPVGEAAPPRQGV